MLPAFFAIPLGEHSLSLSSCNTKIDFKYIKVLNIKRKFLGMRKIFSKQDREPKSDKEKIDLFAT